MANNDIKATNMGMLVAVGFTMVAECRSITNNNYTNNKHKIGISYP